MRFIIIGIIMLYPFAGLCQTRTILGSVKDQKGRAVVSATVTAISSKSSTQTDADGRFSVLTESVDTLIISAIGFASTTIPVIGQQGITVTMQVEIVSLEEVQINTGYQRIPKERATGSFSHINREMFNQQVSTDVLSRLEAVANGLYVLGKSAGVNEIRIRGLSTINGNRTPLIILDNFPYEGYIENINPNDVESITILKDAAAASIWGAKAGNGVIVITTKKGSVAKQISIEMNTNFTIAQKPDLFYQPIIPSSDIVDLELFLFSKRHRFSDTTNTNAGFSPLYEALFKIRNGQIPLSDSASIVDGFRNQDVRNDFLKYMYRNAVNRQTAFNVSGGSEKNTWYFSMGLDQNTSNLDAESRRTNIRFENTFKPSKKLQISVGAYATNTSSTNGRMGFDELSIPGGVQPYVKLADDDGNATPFAYGFNKRITDTAGGGKLLDWNQYPLIEHKFRKSVHKVSDWIFNLGLQHKFSANFTLDLRYQYQRQIMQGETLYEEESSFARDLINTFTQINRVSGAVTYIVPRGDILANNEAEQIAHSGRAQLNFAKKWRNHSVSAIGGAEARDLKSESATDRIYGYNSDIITFSLIDNVNRYQTFPSGSLARIPDGRSISSTNNRFISYFINAAYSFRNKYTFSASARKDGSNLLGVSTNDKWKPLWSAGILWDILQERFSRSSFFSDLKVRGTYGYSGNMDPTQTAITVLTYIAPSPYTGTPYSIVGSYYNPEMRWEKVGMFNFGIDFSIKNRRISGSIEHYRKYARDLFGTVPIDYTAGLDRMTLMKNVAKLDGTGWDLMVNTINIKSRTFKWASTFNLCFNSDRIKEYYSTTSVVNIGRGVSLAGVKDRPVVGVYSFRWAGLDPLTGDPRGYLDGHPSNNYSALLRTDLKLEELKYHGPANPPIFGSIQNALSWNHFSVSASINYKFGYFFKRPSIKYSVLLAQANGHKDYLKRWKLPGDEKVTSIPSFVYPNLSQRDDFYSNSEVLVESGSHIRLQYISLRYQFLPKRLQNRPFKAADLYLYINNIGLIWRANKHGIDPEYTSSPFPPSLSYSVGIRTTL